jgi:superfamily II DNA or RNA helicase
VSKPQELRPYQLDRLGMISTAIEKRKTDGTRHRVLVPVATGGGKTTIFAEQIRRFFVSFLQRYNRPPRIVLFVHNREIVFQMVERVQNQCAELDSFYIVNGIQRATFGIVMGKHNNPHARIVFATRQSLHPKRLQKLFSTGAPDLIIVDEAHHVAPGNTYLDIINEAVKQNPDVIVTGYTATPKRSDRKALAAGFDTMIEPWSLFDGIKDGFLVPATFIKVSSGIDLSNVKSTAGDYKRKEMLSLLEAANWLDLAFEAYETYLRGKRHHILAFMPSVQMSRSFVGMLVSKGVTAAHIDANTDKALRAEILRKFQQGEIEIVSNYNVLTEGFDAPCTDALIDARPSRSETVKTQIWGRGLRLFYGKVDCWILDLACKDVRALKEGTLKGKLRTCKNELCGAQFFMGFSHCPRCGQIAVEKTDKQEKEDGEGGFIVAGSKQIMSGLSAEIRPLLDQMSATWFRDEREYMSVSAGKEALIILPPTYEDAASYRERYMNGEHYLNTVSDLTSDERYFIIAQMERLRRMIERCESYTLYHVDIKGKVNHLRANTDSSLTRDRSGHRSAQDRG